MDKFIKVNIASAVGSFITNPLFVLKVRKQTSSLSYSCLISSINKNEGIRAFYKGYGTTVLNNTKLGIQFPLYDYCRECEIPVLESSLISKMVSTCLFN